MCLLRLMCTLVAFGVLFRSWFKNLGKADAGGYRWGRDNGMNFWRGLRVSLTTSLVTAINGGMLELPGR